ncbi:MAG TPA: hypothetical protein VFY71_18450 [Planctomycetota bacterium]|nr:hypothetical protein [Planctomycetota bacterium]
MLRRLVIIVVIVGVAALVALLSRSDSGGAGAGDVLRGARRDESLPSFAADGAGERGAAAPTGIAPAAPAAPAAAGDEGLRITVLHSDGVPAVGAFVLLQMPADDGWSGRTGPDGVASGPAVDAQSILWIDGVLRGPHSFGLAAPRGDVTIRMPPGETLEGRVLVDGGPPGEPFALALAPHDDEDIPSAVRKRLECPELGFGELQLPAEAGQLIQGDGHFRFSGLPAGWEGNFRLPEAVVEEEGETLVAQAGDRTRLLRVRRVPRILLRAMLPSGEPAAHAVVDATVFGPDAEDGYSRTTDNDGRLVVPMLRWVDTTSFELEIVDAANSARLSLKREVADPKHDLNLGDIVLEAAWAVAFRALDVQGEPIRGAIGATECGPLIKSEPTGYEGLGWLVGVPAGCEALRVGAARCEITEVALPAPPPAEPIDVVLLPCASLDVQVVPGDGRPRPGLTVRFHTSAATYRRIGGFDQNVQELGTTDGPYVTLSSHQAADGTVSVDRGSDHPVPESGHVALGCQFPGDPIDVALVDNMRHVLWKQDAFTMHRGEPVTLTAPVSEVPNAFDVLVTDAVGAPVAGATVRVMTAEETDPKDPGRGINGQSNEAGVAHYKDVYSPLVTIECTRNGFASTRLGSVAPVGVVHVVMEAGLSVMVHFVDGAGRPSPVTSAWVRRVDGESLTLRSRAAQLLESYAALGLSSRAPGDWPPADYRFDDLPNVPLVACARISNRTFEQPFDPRVGDVRCVVPDTGRLVVRGVHASKTERSLRLVAKSAADADEKLEAYLHEEDLAAGTYTWPVALPGSYSITLVRVASLGMPEEILAGPVAAEVRAGEEATVTLP